MYKKKKRYYKEKYVWKVVIQILAGLRALHRVNIVHRDMKSANIFLSKDGRAKLGDFNVSEIEGENLTNMQIGTPLYSSPEVFKNVEYSIKSDIWSLGCAAYEMCQLKPPFQADSMDGLFKKVCKG